eukprot:3306831-Rhodomonas_salina.1
MFLDCNRTKRGPTDFPTPYPSGSRWGCLRTPRRWTSMPWKKYYRSGNTPAVLGVCSDCCTMLNNHAHKIASRHA